MGTSNRSPVQTKLLPDVPEKAKGGGAFNWPPNFGFVGREPVEEPENPSPGSCVTNDSVFHDGCAAGDAEIASAAHANAAFEFPNARENERSGAIGGAFSQSAKRSGASDAAPADGATAMMITAGSLLSPSPSGHKAMEHSPAGGGCKLLPLVPAETGITAPVPLLLHVKNEPVEDSGGGALNELQKLTCKSEMARLLENAEKQSELLNSTSQCTAPEIDSSQCTTPEIDSTPQYSTPEVKNRNSNPGRRVQGGRIYDSTFGKTCHWCRQKTVEHHVKCRQCTIHYCGACLMNRNGENILEELAEGMKWLCPKCRKGCGPGCVNCCNCGPCRKADGKAPTGLIIWQVRGAGFNNVHDYLVHLETGETPEEIAKRKVGRDWTNCGRFAWKETSDDSEGCDASSPSGGSHEFTLDEETSRRLHQGKIAMNVLKNFVQSQSRRRGAKGGAVPTGIRSQVKSMRGALPPERSQFQENSAPRSIQVDLALRNKNSGMRACKREYAEVNAGSDVRADVEDSAVAKRRRLEGHNGEEQHALVSSRSSLPGPFSGDMQCKLEPITLNEHNPGIIGVNNGNEASSWRRFIVDADTPDCQARPDKDSASENELALKEREASVLNSVVKIEFNDGANQQTFEQRGLECPNDLQGTEYRTKLKSALARPFDAAELETLEKYAKCRKPVQRLRQMRGRTVDVVTEDEGLSYLDHHQDFALKLEEAYSPAFKLALLRGFFFWLQHSCMEGAFKPWSGAPTESRPQSGDCIETDGPDCQVTAVLLQLDNGKDTLQPDESDEAHRRKFQFLSTIPRPIAITDRVRKPGKASNPLGCSSRRQALLRFPAVKNRFPVQHVKLPKMKGQVSVQPFRVVLGLPAPALLKK